MAAGRLKGRGEGQPQFEVFSSDWMLDVDNRPWLIEFNFGPVLFDPEGGGQALTTPGKKKTNKLTQITVKSKRGPHAQ